MWSTCGSCGRGAAPLCHGPGFLGHPSCIDESTSQQHFDVGVEASKIVGRPLGQRVVDGWIDSQQYWFAINHGLVVQRPGVDDRRGRLIAAENDHEVARHGGLAFLIEFDDAPLR